jgi:5-methyltetrahydrofolate--homocysteine methyltransferase
MKMLIVGERINTSRKVLNEAVERPDGAQISAEARRQTDAEAAYIDVNAGSRSGTEMADVTWLVETVEGAVETPLSLDSPDPRILLAMCNKVKKAPPINSTTAEHKRFEEMQAVFQERKSNIVALCMDDRGIPASTDQVLENAQFLVAGLSKIGVPLERIYLDPLIQPVSVNSKNGTWSWKPFAVSMRSFREYEPSAVFPTCPMACRIGFS